MSDRKVLREEYARIRAEIHCEQFDEKIKERVLASFCAYESFFVYCAFRSEVATLPLIDALLAAGKKVCVPRIENKVMLSVPYAPLREGAYGIPAPEGGADTPCDVTLTPLLAFDEEGYRLGYGGGYYDAYFSRHKRTLRVGLAYSAQKTDKLSHEMWDIPLHCVVTEKDIFLPTLDTKRSQRV